MGVTSQVSEIPLLSKTAKFPFQTMGYSPWWSKNLIDRNWLKKFMQIEVDEICMHTNFGGRSLSSIGVIAHFCSLQKRPIFPFGPWTIYSPWSSKNLIDRNWLKKFMQISIDVTCMYTNFGGCDLSGFGDTPNFPFRPWTIVHGRQKI